MATWQTIFGLSDPVVGDVVAFHAATDRFATMSARAHDIVQSVHHLASQSSVSELEGKAGDAFRARMREVDDAFDDVPGVIGQVHGCLQVHTTKLRELRTRADEALARAVTRWNQVRTAEQDLTADATRVTQLRSQLDYLHSVASPDDPNSMSQVSIAEARLSNAEAETRSSRHTLTTAQRDLDDVAEEWKVLRSDEAALNRDTAHWLRQIDLRSLADQSALEKFLIGFAEFMINPAAFVAEHWEEIRRITLDALWVIKEALEVVALVLLVVALFVPGLNMIALGVAVALLVANLVLWSTQHPSPFTGDTVSTSDVLWSALGVVTAGSSAILAGQIAKAGARGGSLIAGADPNKMVKLVRISDQLASYRRTAAFVDAAAGLGNAKDIYSEGKDLIEAAQGKPNFYSFIASPFSFSRPVAPVPSHGPELTAVGCPSIFAPVPVWNVAVLTGQCRIVRIDAEVSQ